MREKIFHIIKIYKKNVITCGAAGLAIYIFVFQTLQTWCDAGIKKDILRWIFPTSVTILIFIIVVLINISIELYRKKSIEAPEALAEAILIYAEQLKRDNRDSALVDFRNRLSHTLHILGNHEIRSKIGFMALGSATIIEDKSSIIEIMIDDLGWCNYLLGNKELAINYINKGIMEAEQYLNNKQSDLRVSLAKAKGLRHLAILEAKENYELSNQKLQEAYNILNVLDYNIHEVKIDIAQIYHARATIIFNSLGLNNDVKIRKDDIEGIKKINEAIQYIQNASEQFKQVGEMDRYVKSLYLHYSLLESIDNKEGCLEIKAILDRAVKSSQWITNKGIESIIK